jgi:hypothetical protein
MLILATLKRLLPFVEMIADAPEIRREIEASLFEMVQEAVDSGDA